MSLVCKLMGHRYIDTFDIVQKESYFDINDAKYCNRCGKICLCDQLKVVR